MNCNDGDDDYKDNDDFVSILDACKRTVCTKPCFQGYVKNENGCETCICKNAVTGIYLYCLHI